jgi:hypothetical protein
MPSSRASTADRSAQGRTAGTSRGVLLLPSPLGGEGLRVRGRRWRPFPPHPNPSPLRGEGLSREPLRGPQPGGPATVLQFVWTSPQLGESAMSTVPCPYCNAGLRRTEVADGWCESCGKKLPPRIARVASGMRSERCRQQSEGMLSRLATWLSRVSVAGMLFTLAGCIGIPVWGSRLPFDHLPQPEQIGAGLAVALLTLVATWLVAKGLAVLGRRHDAQGA